MNIKQWLFYQTCITMFKTMNGLAPEYLDVFTQRECAYSLRSTDTFVLPQPRIDMFKTAFSYYGAKCWNTVPDDIKSSDSVMCFKGALKRHILG